MPDDTHQTPEPVWAIVANVLHDRPYGPNGEEIRHGTRLFAPGSKVYCITFSGSLTAWAVGRHRVSHRYLTMGISPSHLANWGVELVYSPHVIACLHSNGSPERRQELEAARQHLSVLPTFQQVQLPTRRLPQDMAQPPTE